MGCGYGTFEEGISARLLNRRCSGCETRVASTAQLHVTFLSILDKHAKAAGHFIQTHLRHPRFLSCSDKISQRTMMFKDNTRK
jgi:hypothetical protein